MTGSTVHITGVGNCSITASQAGNSNYNAAPSVTRTFEIRYAICLLYDPTKSYKAGSTAPLKLYLCDTAGTDTSSSSVVVNATSLKKVDNSASPQLVTDSGNANPDGNFRFDTTLGPSGGYIFNLSTKSPSPALGQGTTALATGSWVLSLTVGGVSGYSIQFDVK